MKGHVMSASALRLPDDHPARKDLRSLGYECTRWVTAMAALQAKVKKGRLPTDVLTFLQGWMPQAPVSTERPEAFDLVSGHLGLHSAELREIGNPAWQALLHLPALRDFWTAELRAAHYTHLLKCVPKAWCMDPAPLPPGAVIAGLGIGQWEDLDTLQGHFKRHPLDENRVVLTAERTISDGWRARYVLQEGQITLQEAFFLS